MWLLFVTALFIPALAEANHWGTKRHGFLTWDTFKNHGKVEKLCRRQWPDDQWMRGACVRNQWGGIEQLADYPPKDVAGRDFEVVRKTCRNQWEDDFAMWAACERNQVQALRTLKDPPPVPYEFRGIVRETCRADWPVDFAMRVACERNAARRYGQ